jgi:hypothetical protein
VRICLARTVQKIKCKYEKIINERLQTFSGQAIASYNATISCLIFLLRRIEMAGNFSFPIATK